MEPGESDEQSR